MENSTNKPAYRSQFVPFNQQTAPTFPPFGEPGPLPALPDTPSRFDQQFSPISRGPFRAQKIVPLDSDDSEFKPSGWSELMTRYVGIIPQPVYLVLLALTAGFVMLGKVPTEISMVAAIMALCSFTLGEIGKRLPILRDIGAAAIIVLIAPSYLAFQKVLPASLVKVVSNFLAPPIFSPSSSLSWS